MSEEIELILYKLEQNYKCDKEQYFILYKQDEKQLLDYITNLQNELKFQKEKDKEIERLNNIIDELENMLINELKNSYSSVEYKQVINLILYKLKELKGSDLGEFR